MNEPFVFQKMLTCIGNKRKLVENIFDIVNDLRIKMNKDKLNFFDGFGGSSVISRSMVSICNRLYFNDLELYSYLMAKCFLEKPTDEQKNRIIRHLEKMNNIATDGPYTEGIICKLYAPKNTHNIQDGERCFYTRENALIIDTLRKYIKDNIETTENDIFVYCITPLLIKASIHNNTSGVFKGFHKNGKIGCFGGKGQNALSRIMKNITLDIPIWSDDNFNTTCYNGDINNIINELPNDIDIIYLDPPYNSHPYGSNYFMLNVIATNIEPSDISKVSGIPTNWNKSSYNYKNEAIIAMKNLIDIGLIKSKYIVLSYNNEGIIPREEWYKIFNKYDVAKYQIKYDTYKGARNLKDRDNKVFEILYVISSK